MSTAFENECLHETIVSDIEGYIIQALEGIIPDDAEAGSYWKSPDGLWYRCYGPADQGVIYVESVTPTIPGDEMSPAQMGLCVDFLSKIPCLGDVAINFLAEYLSGLECGIEDGEG